jgi:hypothetical protein
MVILYAYLLTGFIVILRTGIADMLAKSFHELVLDSLAKPERSHRKKAILGGLPLFLLLCVVYYTLYPVALFAIVRNRHRARRSLANRTGTKVPYQQPLPGYPPIYHN